MATELLRSESENGALASVADESAEDGIVTFLMFEMGQRIYSTDVQTVREIVDLSKIEQLPNAPHDVLGMIDLRSQSIPVIDLAARMQIAANPQQDARIIVFEFGKPDALRLLGIVADRVLGVNGVAPERIELLDHAISGWQSDSVLGVIRSDDAQSLVLKIEQYLDVPDLPGDFDFD